MRGCVDRNVGSYVGVVEPRNSICLGTRVFDLFYRQISLTGSSSRVANYGFEIDFKSLKKYMD